MERFKKVWEVDSPYTLTDIVIRFCLRNPQTYSELVEVDAKTKKEKIIRGKNYFRRKYYPFCDIIETPPENEISENKIFRRLSPGIQLPAEICEKMFAMAADELIDTDDEFCTVFSDTRRTPLRSVSIRESSITDEGLSILLRHNLQDLDINNCPRITGNCFKFLNEHCNNLVNLTLGENLQILPYSLNCDDEDSDVNLMTDFEARGHILKADRLSRLCIRDFSFHKLKEFMELLLKPLKNLCYLDLSGMLLNEPLSQSVFFKSTPNLVSLVLHNVTGLETAISVIFQLKKLKDLDISHNRDFNYDSPTIMLRAIVTNLLELESLDISGTNLGGIDFDKETSCGIPGLESRMKDPLRFLGLFMTHMDACSRPNIPALKISGDSNEKQLITAGQLYLDRKMEMENVLIKLSEVFRFNKCQNIKESLNIILLAMDKHQSERAIQISGSACLYYVVSSHGKYLRDLNNAKMRRKIILALLNGMRKHKNNVVMVRNGFITLCHFTFPQDMLFDCQKLVQILLFTMLHYGRASEGIEDNGFLEWASISLLNSLACNVDYQLKRQVGALGAIEKTLSIIQLRVDIGVCDNVMDTAWYIMLNLTDGTPSNCKIFLEHDGVNLFLQCKNAFPNKQELLRSMVGLLGNVAEVPSLRPKLMTREFISEFAMLLDSNMDGIEVSYNAAGILAHMASDGPSVWVIEDPSREEVLSKMVSAIERWNLNGMRNINYKSFLPIFRLVNVEHTPHCQHWAIWALANLTSIDDKFCALLEEEGGLQLLEKLSSQSKESESSLTYPRILIDLAMTVQNNIQRWKDNLCNSQKKDIAY